MGVASGCGEQEVGVASGSGWNLWVWLLGVVVSVLFCSSIPTFCSFLKNVFRSCTNITWPIVVCLRSSHYLN